MKTLRTGGAVAIVVVAALATASAQQVQTPSVGDHASTLAVNPAWVYAQRFASLASPVFTGTPSAPTPPNGDNSGRLATTAFVLANAVGGTSGGAVNSAAWTDASTTITALASTPAALTATTARVALHIWNIGAATVCMNYTSPAVASGTGCAPGSFPIQAGAAYLEDQPGNVSPEAVSLACTTNACPLTIKVH